MGPNPDADLIASQFSHALDLLRAENKALAKELEHYRQLADSRLTQLEKATEDYETRLRSLQDSSTQFKVLAGLATGGGLLSLITLIRNLAGG